MTPPESLNAIRRALEGGRTLRNLMGGNVGGGPDVYKAAFEALAELEKAAIAAMGTSDPRGTDVQSSGFATRKGAVLEAPASGVASEISIVGEVKAILDSAEGTWEGKSEGDAIWQMDTEAAARKIVSTFGPYLRTTEPDLRGQYKCPKCFKTVLMLQGDSECSACKSKPVMGKRDSNLLDTTVRENENPTEQPVGQSCGEAWIKYSTEVLMYRAGNKSQSANEWDRLQEAFDAGWRARPKRESGAPKNPVEQMFRDVMPEIKFVDVTPVRLPMPIGKYAGPRPNFPNDRIVGYIYRSSWPSLGELVSDPMQPTIPVDREAFPGVDDDGFQITEIEDGAPK